MRPLSYILLSRSCVTITQILFYYDVKNDNTTELQCHEQRNTSVLRCQMLELERVAGILPYFPREHVVLLQ